MRAAVRDRYGGPGVVELRELPVPVPRADEVLVRVRAASVNRGDLDGIHPKPGFVRLFIGLRRPRNPRIGLDAAGVVEAAGPDVTRFRPGDAVFADLFSHGMGAFAETVCATERAFERIPDGMSFEDAATLPHAGILALQSLRTRGGRTPAPGERVLVGGASGNVGPFAVQIAKAYGAEVTGVCSTAKMDFVRSVGADHLIDYTAVDYTRTGERYDWIVDVDSHHSVLHVRPALRSGGVYVTLGGGGLAIGDALIVGSLVTAATSRRMGLMLGWKPFAHDDVEALKALIAAGQVRPFIDRRYPLERIVEALTEVDEGRPSGKVVITVA